MADMEQLERELLARHPERWVRHHLASFPADYFRVFDSAEVSRHLEAMLTLTDDRPVHVRAESECGGVWRVDVVGYDAFQFLSTVCTLLAVSGLTILDGRVFTSQPPPPEPTVFGFPGGFRAPSVPRGRRPRVDRTVGPGSSMSFGSARSARRPSGRTGRSSRMSSAI